MKPNGSRDAGGHSRPDHNTSLLWLSGGCGLLILIGAWWRPLGNPPQARPGEAVGARQPAARRVPSSSFRPRTGAQSNSFIPPSAEEIVAAKLTQFGKSREELATALARRHHVEVPAEVTAFFQAVQSGNWDQIEASFKIIDGGDSTTSHAPQRSEEVQSLWPAIVDAYGAAEQVHLWPPQKLLDYGNAILESLRPGMVYVGGTDNGRWIPELLNETGVGEPRIVVTQNGLADGSYLEYLAELYSDRIKALTLEDSQKAFQEYLGDAQRRFEHDKEFPDEARQVLPGEEFQAIGGRFQVSGQVAVMAINERLLQSLMEKNPDLSFAMEESFPLKGTYANALPLGPLMELRVTDPATPFTPERAAQSVDYWRNSAQGILADPEGSASETVLKSYSHDADAAANLLAAKGFLAEAEETYQLAVQLCPYSPEAITGLANLAARAGRTEEARRMLDDFARKYPEQSKAMEQAESDLLRVSKSAPAL